MSASNTGTEASDQIAASEASKNSPGEGAKISSGINAARPRPSTQPVWGFVILAVLGIAAPFTGVYPVLLMTALCFALFACAFNLLLGFTGLLSFGHAVFLASAGYAAGYVIKLHGWPPELGLLFAVAVSAALGYVIGSLAIRRQGIYFAMITLALSQMVYFFFFASEIHRRRGRPAGRAARRAVRFFRFIERS